MTKPMYRIITLIAACSMVAAVLGYSRAIAENPSDTAQEIEQAINVCTLDPALDPRATESLEAAPVSSAVPASDDVVVNACTYASCRTSSDCPDDHPAAPFFCNPQNRCCAPL